MSNKVKDAKEFATELKAYLDDRFYKADFDAVNDAFVKYLTDTLDDIEDMVKEVLNN